MKDYIIASNQHLKKVDGVEWRGGGGVGGCGGTLPCDTFHTEWTINFSNIDQRFVSGVGFSSVGQCEEPHTNSWFSKDM